MPLQRFAAAAMVSRCPLLGLILTNLFRNRPHIYFSPSHWEALTSVLQTYWQGWSVCSTAIHPGDSFYSLCFTNSRFMRTSLLNFSPSSSSFSIFQAPPPPQTHLPPPYLFPLPPLVCFPPPLVSSFISLLETVPFLPLSCLELRHCAHHLLLLHPPVMSPPLSPALGASVSHRAMKQRSSPFPLSISL